MVPAPVGFQVPALADFAERRYDVDMDPGKRYNPTKFDADAQEACVRVYATTGNKTAAAIAAGVSLTTVTHYLRTAPEFADRMREAKKEFVSVLEAEAYRRAVDGWEEERAGRDGATYTVRKYDGTLLLRLLKRHDPERWGDRVKVDQTTSVKGGLSLGLAELTPEARRLIREAIEAEEKARGEKSEPEA